MLLGDYADQPHPELDALAHSGDYFITLATKLETIAAELPEVSVTTSSLLLSRLAQELEYLQHHYELKSKPTNRLRYHSH